MVLIISIGFFALLILLCGLYCRYVKFRDFVIDSWPNLLINFVFVLVGAGIAILGVYWAFQKESDRNFYTEINIFKRSFNAVIGETASNQALVKDLKNKIDQTHFNIRHIPADVSENLIQNPFLYKFAGQEYLYALNIYLTKVRTTNRMLDHLYDDYKLDGRITDNNVKKVSKYLDNLLYYTFILQYQSQCYVYLYGDDGQIVPGNQDMIMRWLKKEEKISASEIKQKLQILVDSDKEKKEKLYKGTKSIWEEVRNQ